MTRASEPLPHKGRYMTLSEVARELGLKSPGSIRNKIYAGDLVGVNVGTTGSSLRVTRESFDAYCARIEAEALARFGRAS